MAESRTSRRQPPFGQALIFMVTIIASNHLPRKQGSALDWAVFAWSLIGALGMAWSLLQWRRDVLEETRGDE